MSGDLCLVAVSSRPDYPVVYITGINHKLVQGKLESATNDNLIPYLKRKQLSACIKRRLTDDS